MGTVASVTLVGVLISVLKTPEFQTLLMMLIELIFKGLPAIFGF